MSESRCGAFRLLNGGGFYQNPEVPVDLPFPRVDELGNAAQKHRHSRNVLAGPSELWGIVPLIHDVVLDLAGVAPGATRRVMCMRRNVLYRMRWRRRRLVLPPLS